MKDFFSVENIESLRIIGGLVICVFYYVGVIVSALWGFYRFGQIVALSQLDEDYDYFSFGVLIVIMGILSWFGIAFFAGLGFFHKERIGLSKRINLDETNTESTSMYVNKIIAIVTDIIPNNCNECILSERVCDLPMKAYPNHEEILKFYTKKRHKNCPLIKNEID